MSRTGLPEWLEENDEYTPAAGKASFVEKNIAMLAASIARLRAGADRKGLLGEMAPAVKLTVTIMLILFVTLSRNPAYVWIVSATLLVLLSMLPVRLLKRILAVGLIGAGFTGLMMLPAWLFGFGNRVLLMPIKVWLTVSFSGLLALTTSWHELIRALNMFRIPDLFILILDMSLKHIVVLTDAALALFYALKVRSVGRPLRHSGAGIAGTLFMKSKEMTDELYDALVCRGFSGHYIIMRKKRPFHLLDGLSIGCVLIYGLLFFYLG